MTKAFDCALRLLARREHGHHELTEKLVRKGYALQDSKQAVTTCQELDLQSDNRFAASIAYTRFQQGYGPIRIMQELQAKFIDKELVTEALQQYHSQWEEQALLVWQKKFSNSNTLAADLQKQQRFLLYRGFPADIVSKTLRLVKERQI